MRIMACALLLLAAGSLAAQEQSRWRRVYTYDDAFIEMEEIKLSFGNFGRVRFRTVFRKPRPLPGAAGVTFKTVVEDMEILCAEQKYRLGEAVYLGAKGAPVHTYKARGDEEWEQVRTHMMLRLLTPACRMIEKKRL